MASAVNNAFIVHHSTCVFLISNLKKEHYRVVKIGSFGYPVTLLLVNLVNVLWNKKKALFS
jgi:hypothetical protein